MKKLLLFSILIALSTTLFSQTKTWVGSSGGLFSESSNWNPAGVPSDIHDVIIPTGSNININIPANIKSFALQGNATAATGSGITFTNASSIAANATLNWSSGNFFGSGTLTNNGTVNITGNNSVFLGNSVTLLNNGTINFGSTVTMFIGSGSPTLNNAASGVINLNTATSIQAQGGAGTIINSGLIRKQQNAGLFSIDIPFQNNNGTISVEMGTLRTTSSSTTFTNGIYNVTSGNTLEWANSFTLSGTLTGQLDGQINWTGGLNVAPATEAIFDFNGSTGVNWTSGFFGGDGTLTNRSTLNLVSANGKSVRNSSQLKNEGIINFVDATTLSLGFGSPTFNNTTTGIFNLNSDSSISPEQGVGTLINTGSISRQQSTGIFRINANFQNNNGTISVESGTLKLDNDNSMLIDGIYNVSGSSTLEWAFGLTLLGTLTGQLDGQINWTGGLNVAPATEAIFDFNGSTGVNWTSGSFGGNGTLTNRSTLNLVSANGKSIIGQSNLNNEGIINYNGAGALTLGGGSPTLTNATTGVINLNIDSSFTFASGIGTVVNSGLIIKEQTSGTFIMSTNNNNMSPGKIISENGLISFGNYMGNGTIGGNASVRFQGGTVFEGTIAPGNSPGTLTLDSSYNSTSAAILDIEINGPNAGTQYDVFAVQSNAIFNGIVNVTLGFAPTLNNEFVVATTSGTIGQCNLATTSSADFNGMTYRFDVLCRNNNQVVLKVTNVTLGVDDFELSSSSIQLYPNPVKNILTIKNVNNLELENGSIIDITGKIISSFDLRDMASSKEISLDTFSSGMYFVKINGLNSSITKRIVKQ